MAVEVPGVDVVVREVAVGVKSGCGCMDYINFHYTTALVQFSLY